MYLRAFSQGTGTYPVFYMSIEEYERRRMAVEQEAVRLNMTRAEWEPLLPVPPMNYINDPATGKWYRAGDITTIAWEILPPVVGGTPGTWQTGRILSEAEAAAWIAQVEASRQPFYGSVLTIPSRMGWTQPYTVEEVNLWATALGWPNEIVAKFFDSFPTREAAVDWIQQAQVHPEMWNQKATELFPPAPRVEIPGVTPPAPAPPPPPTPVPTTTTIIDTVPPPTPVAGGNVAPPGTTPPGHRYPILPYAPNAGTALLRSRGWPPDVIGFWLTQAFGGDLALTEAFLLSFSGREALEAWIAGKTPADIYARADAALASRRAAAPPGLGPPAGAVPGEPGGIGIGWLALAGAAAIFLMRR